MEGWLRSEAGEREGFDKRDRSPQCTRSSSHTDAPLSRLISAIRLPAPVSE